MIYENEKHLQEACLLWQKNLRLQDWIVKPSIRRSRDMVLKDVSGECEFNIRLKMASIRLLDPIDYPENLMTDQDMELTLVHELLHLHFAPFDDSESDSSREIAIEQAIDSISRGIVNIHRERGLSCGEGQMHN